MLGGGEGESKGRLGNGFSLLFFLGLVAKTDEGRRDGGRSSRIWG